MFLSKKGKKIEVTELKAPIDSESETLIETGLWKEIRRWERSGSEIMNYDVPIVEGKPTFPSHIIVLVRWLS